MKQFLAVGINHFQRYPQDTLAGCVPDAHSMDDAALSLGVDNIITLTDSQATKRNVIGDLQGLVAAAKVGKINYLGFSFSAHGTHYPRPEEAGGLGEALVCYDIAEKGGDWDPDTIIKDKELHDLLNQVPQSCVVETWLDTCYSGGMDRALIIGKPRETVGFKFPRFLHNPSNVSKELRVANVNMNQGLNSNIIMWTASSEAQTSADAYIAGGAHGAFTWYWTQAFKANPGLSRVELLIETREGLQAGGYAQFPRLKCWNAKAQAKVGE